MKSQTEIDVKKTIKILVSPNDNGFSCAIDIENSKNLPFVKCINRTNNTFKNKMDF